MFLQKVAQDISKHKNEYLLDLQILFSNKRAIKYFNQEFNSQNKETFWRPECKSISDFIEEYSYLKKADEFSLIYQLFLSYKKICSNSGEESFESFYNWGKIILSDFDDIDKNIVDAKQVFRLIEEHKEIENSFDYLTEEQKELLSNFFVIFKEKSELKTNFITIWNCLFDVYCDYKKTLSEQGIGYSGMIYRNFLERLKNEEIQFSNQNFAVVGFNVLNKCEESIFKILKERYSIDFYWDYDEYYVNSDHQEAGIFMKENLINFPHNKDFAKNNFNNIINNKEKINLIRTSYEIENTYYIKTWIKNLETTYQDDLKQNQIAIILGNEKILPFVLKSLPQTIGKESTKVNIAMGYPLINITLFSEIEEKIDSIQNKEKSIIEQLEELTLFVKEKGEKSKEGKIIQSCYSIIKILDDFKNVISFNGIESLQNNFLKKTLLFLLRRVSIPFESDATDGIQIMGLLESRNLTFKHVLVLSANDDNIPRVNSVNSFIPLSIRDAFGLIDQKKKISVFAYYFYRLLQERKDLDFVYNTFGRNEKIKEMTRFLLQLRFETPIPFEEKSISLPLIQYPIKDIENLFKKTDEHLEHLKQRQFSASMINTYLDCARKFYFQYIKHLKPIEDKDISYIVFGKLFHSTVEEYLKSNYQLLSIECASRAFNALEKAEEKESITQSAIETCIKYLDALRTHYKTDNKFVEAEKRIENININLTNHIVKLMGVIDRIDQTPQGDYVVIDYKTSKKKKEYKNNISELFDNNKKDKRNSYALQILYYAYLLQKKGYKVVDTQLIYPHLLHKDNNCSVSLFDNAIYNEYETHLKNCLEEIFDKEKDWYSTENCEYCDFKEICSNFEASNEEDF